MGTNRSRVTICVVSVLLAGGALAFSWWDWAFPGMARLWWSGERVYGYFWRRLLWMVIAAQGACLALWGLAFRTGTKRRQDLLRVTLCFAPAFLASLVLLRYRLHPLGVQPGSSAWTYWLVAVTAAVPASSLAHVWLSLRLPAVTRRWTWIAVCTLTATYAIVYSALSVARHDTFRSHALDLGTMDQAVWNTSQGRVLERTPLYRHPADGSRYENRLLDAKLELVLLPVSALYWLWPDPRVLLVVQTLLLAAGAIPLYLLVYHGTRSTGLALLLGAAYLVYLPLHYVSMADMHPSALMVPFLIASWLAMRRGQWPWYYVWLLLALCCRIDAAFVALALGVVVALSQREARRQGVYTVALAVAWLVINFAVVVPLVRQLYSGAGDLVSRRFGVLGSGPVDVLRTVITRPAFVLRRLLNRDNAQALVDLLAPTGFSCLLAPLALVPALPVLGINLLAESAWQGSIHAHYMAPVIPFVWIAVAEGVTWLAVRRSRRWAAVLSTFILLNTLLATWALSPYPPGRSFRLADYVQASIYEANLRAVIAEVPGGTTVCAQSDIHPHLSQRRDAALFPRCRLTGEQETEYVVLDLDPTAVKSPVDYHAFYELVAEWLERPDYGVTALRGGSLVLRRGAPRDNAVHVADELQAYGRDLYRVEFLESALPPSLRADDYYRIWLKLRNTGSQQWHSRGQLPVRLSYRWLDEDGDQVLSVPSLRTDLPHRVAPGYAVRLHAELLTPQEPGAYTLEWDVLREGDAWFSSMGAETLRQRVSVTPLPVR